MNARQVLPHDWFPQPLPDNVQIGAHSWVYSSFAFRHYRSQRECGVRIGHDTGIYNGTFFDLDVDGELTIGNYCTLVGAIVASNARVSIGDYTFIAHEVTIADHFAAVPPGSLANGLQPQKLGGDVVIGPNVWIGARAIILAGAEIGEGAIVGAASVVNGRVPRFTRVVGNPSRILTSEASTKRRRQQGHSPSKP
jgi:acetyltransferase-like isoleucine patch superfamily enzyme